MTSRRSALRLLVIPVVLLSAVTIAADSPKPPDPPITLQRLKWDDYVARVTKNPRAKFILIDAWATNCAPCKENFPHLVEMHSKYAKDGLAVASLSLDDISDAAALKAAEQFLREKKAAFTNVVLDEEFGVGFEKLDINSIPAVFLYRPDGTLAKRFTLDDPDKQFTYDEVEKEVQKLLKNERKPIGRTRPAQAK